MSQDAWVVFRAGLEQRWGGEIRRSQIYERLAVRTDALVVESWPRLRRRIKIRIWESVLPAYRSRSLAVPDSPPVHMIPWIVRYTDPVALAIYDDPVAQTLALGFDADPDWMAELGRRRRLAMATFRWHIVPTGSFAELAGLDFDRVIVAGNGTLTGAVQPGPWPSEPSIGFVSGAAPGRGIETLIAATRMVRSGRPDVRLFLWLVATSPGAERYLDELKASLRNDPWVSVGTVGHARLGDALAKATILCIPHPNNDYMNVAL
ncbi:MAG: hypothetical protein ACRDGQ_01560, partial [Candidatus Limnocylindrales bacterium]